MIQFMEKNEVYIVENEYGRWCLVVTDAGREQTGNREYFACFRDVITGEEYVCERKQGDMSVLLEMDVTNKDNFVRFGLAQKVFP